MKKTKKLILISIVLIFTSIILSQATMAAVLQANPTTNSSPAKRNGKTWLLNIRQMEITGQAMGLTETINSTTYLGTTESNGIDVHMIKTTEYGALAILSASGFGNPANTTTIDTTTGNKTGVYMQTGAYEWTASFYGTISSVVHRYYNFYSSSTTSAKQGDALTLAWHGASRTWIPAISGKGFRRGGSMGVFGFNGSDYFETIQYATRAVVVSGEGF